MQAGNLRPMALLIALFAGAYIIAALTGVVAQSYWLITYAQQAETLLPIAIAGWAGLIAMILYAVTIIPVLIWVYLAHDNLRNEGLSGLKNTPGWATGSFFLPFANLYFPFAAMRELANRSAGEPEELGEADVDVVFSWWGCWVGGMLLWTLVALTHYVDSIPGIWVTTPFWATQGLEILALIFLSGSAYFLIQTVRTITRDQETGAAGFNVFD